MHYTADNDFDIQVIFDFPSPKSGIADFKRIPKNEGAVLTVWILNFSNSVEYLEETSSNLECAWTYRVFLISKVQGEALQIFRKVLTEF